jgi:hypothetical protein
MTSGVEQVPTSRANSLRKSPILEWSSGPYTSIKRHFSLMLRCQIFALMKNSPFFQDPTSNHSSLNPRASPQTAHRRDPIPSEETSTLEAPELRHGEVLSHYFLQPNDVNPFLKHIFAELSLVPLSSKTSNIIDKTHHSALPFLNRFLLGTNLAFLLQVREAATFLLPHPGTKPSCTHTSTMPSTSGIYPRSWGLVPHRRHPLPPGG